MEQKQQRIELLEMALVGLERLQSDAQQELTKLRGVSTARRKMSAAARKRIAEAQKKRWRKWHQQRSK